MKVVITAATSAEYMSAKHGINKLYTGDSKRFKVVFYASGVGMLSSAVSLTKLVYEERPDLIIQVGIAGTFGSASSIGKVYAVNQEYLADTGVLEQGVWKDIFDLKLSKSSNAPFQMRSLPNPWLSNYNLLKTPIADAITVNQVSTDKAIIEQWQHKYHPQIESMEGAALHYVGRTFQIPFIQLRAVSNVVGVRDKTQWKIADAIAILNQTVLKYVDKAYRLI